MEEKEHEQFEPGYSLGSMGSEPPTLGEEEARYGLLTNSKSGKLFGGIHIDHKLGTGRVREIR